MTRSDDELFQLVEKAHAVAMKVHELGGGGLPSEGLSARTGSSSASAICTESFCPLLQCAHERRPVWTTAV